MTKKLSFDEWLHQVDHYVQLRTGLGRDDIDDWCYTSDYEDGMSPSRSASRAIRNAKEACGLV